MLKKLVVLSTLVAAQDDDSSMVPFFGDSLQTLTFGNLMDNLAIGMRGGSISDHVAQRLREYGFPSDFCEALEEVNDVSLATVATNWGNSVKRDLEDDFSASFYSSDVFGSLLSESTVQVASDYLSTAVTKTTAELETLMTSIVDAEYDNVKAVAQAYLDSYESDGSMSNTTAAATLDVMNKMDEIMDSWAAGVDFSRSMVQRAISMYKYLIEFVYVYETYLDNYQFWLYTMNYVSNQVETALLSALDEVCADNLGFFGLLHAMVEQVKTVVYLLFTNLNLDGAADSMLFDALFDDVINYQSQAPAFFSQFGIQEMLEMAEANLHILSLTIDPFIPFFDLVKAPLCGL